MDETDPVAETREQGAAVWIEGTGAAAVARPFAVDNVPSYAGAKSSLNYEPYYEWGDAADSIDCRLGPSSMHPGGNVGHDLGSSERQGAGDRQGEPPLG